VAETTAPIAENLRTSTAARIGWAILIAATLYVCYFSHLGAIGFVGPDEPRYAWIARDMAETGDWVTPRLYGKPWFEKPPLFYWSAALCFKLFGVSEATARLPSAISALLATLAMAWLALRLYGAETARWLLLLLPTTAGMIGFSHAAATDMPFSSMLSIAMVCAAVVLGLTLNENTPILPRTPWLALVLFGFFLGLAVLAKGPAAIILSGGTIFFWALFTKRWRGSFRLLHPAAIASFCLTGLPWYILCARRNPDFFRIFIVEHNFKRYLTPEFQHIQPFWFYIPILALGLLPWTSSSVLFLRDSMRSWKEMTWLNSPGPFFTCWAVFPVVFFSLSKSKLPGYILPVIPPLQMLAAQRISLRVGTTLPGDRWIRIMGGLTLLSLSLFTLVKSVRTEDFRWAALVLAAGGFAIVFPGNLWRLSQAFAISVLTVIVATTLAFIGYAGSSLDDSVSPRFALHAANAIWNDYSAEHASTYKLQRSFQYSLNFYFHRELPEWSPSRVQPGWVFTSRIESRELQGYGLECVTPSFHSAVILCKDPGSAATLPDGRQPH
jgi:4-amino-4-deoxy-L-arabinose transferase-like glycosyltransferase